MQRKNFFTLYLKMNHRKTKTVLHLLETYKPTLKSLNMPFDYAVVYNLLMSMMRVQIQLIFMNHTCSEPYIKLNNWQMSKASDFQKFTQIR